MLTKREIQAALSTPRAPDKPLDLSRWLHPKQLAFAVDEHPFRVARCSRRAGKTFVTPLMLLDSAMRKPGTVSLYVMRTLKRARQQLWGPLLRYNNELRASGVANATDVRLTLPNGSAVQLAGADTREDVEKWRGDPYGRVIIDEAQILPAFIEYGIDDVLAPALGENAGDLILIGTPPPVPAGYFNSICENPEWSFHHWTFWDNPHVPSELEKAKGLTHQGMLDRELKRKGVDASNPGIRREWFGEIAVDEDALVFRYSAELNDFDTVPDNLGKPSYVISGDLGWTDADAVGVIGWGDESKDAYLVEEHVLTKQTITQLGDLLRELYDRFQPLAMVLDFGGLGTKIAEELRSRWKLPVEAAEKSRKNEHIELLNDGMRSGNFYARKDSRFAQDCMLVEWDRDKSTPDRMVISDRFHSDACDMVLYGYRKALHWLSEEPKTEPEYGTREWALAQAQKQEREHYERLLRHNREMQREREEGMDFGD